ncbi:MAG: SDR family oxidoreductase [Spirosomataceae bacterium]
MPTYQTVFITGCANGIGKHLAEVFYQKGYAVVATDIAIATLQNQTQHWEVSRSLILTLDVTNSEQWRAVVGKCVDKFGRIDIFINNAGVIVPGFLAELSLESIDLQVGVNIKGVLYGAKLAAAQMIKQSSGHIINVASLAGVAPIYGLPIYSATKFAVRAFSIAIAYEMKQYGINVSVICPDLVNTNMLTLQLDHPAAALTFSGNQHLQVEDIERAVFERALGKKQLEIMVPPSRGWQAKIGNLFPKIGFLLTKQLVKKGLLRQASMRH